MSENFYRNSTKRVNDFGLVLSSFNRFRLSKQLTAMANLRYIRHYKQLYLIQKSDYFGVDIEGDYSCLKDKLNINFGVKDLLNSRGKNQQIFKNGDFEHRTDFDFISRKFFVSVTFSFFLPGQNMQSSMIRYTLMKKKKKECNESLPFY